MTKDDFKKLEIIKNQFDKTQDLIKNNYKIEITRFLNQKLFLIEKETDSSYQIGSYGIIAPSSPGSILGWVKITNNDYTYSYFNSEELLEEQSIVKRIDQNEVYAKGKEGDFNFSYSINQIDNLRDKVYKLKRTYKDPTSSRSYQLYIAREIDTDSSYVINAYKEKEKRELLNEYGDEYKNIMKTDEIESYQNSPDSITIKYILKDHFKNGPKIESGGEFLIGKKIKTKTNTYSFTKKYVQNLNDNIRYPIVKIKVLDNSYLIELDKIPEIDSDKIIRSEQSQLLLIKLKNSWISLEY